MVTIGPWNYCSIFKKAVKCTYILQDQRQFLYFIVACILVSIYIMEIFWWYHGHDFSVSSTKYFLHYHDKNFNVNVVSIKFVILHLLNFKISMVSCGLYWHPSGRSCLIVPVPGFIISHVQN